ncbi:MAG: putative heterodisulfide reductase, subunit, partial [Pseudomonadota bacterium]
MVLDYGYRMGVGALLLLVGLGVFSRLMYVRLRLMLAGRPEKRWDLVAERAKRLLQIGIGQKKMFKEPASGLMHAFTFWGFCILSIRTTMLFVQAFAPEFTLPGPLHAAYDFGKDITEAVVLVMILGFFYRRLVVKPARIHYSGEALLILGFIGTLMVTDFLYDGLHYGGMAKAGQADALERIAHAPIGSMLAGIFSRSGLDPATMQWIGEANYWLHLVIILTFLNLLPISKHFHVITALFNVFLSRLEPKGALSLVDKLEERIERGEELGLGRVEALSWKQTLDLYTCTECGRCSVNCPAWNTDKPLNP